MAHGFARHKIKRAAAFYRDPLLKPEIGDGF